MLDNPENSPIGEILRIVAEEGIDLGKEKYSDVKNAIRRKTKEKDYAFVPDAEEAKRLQSLSDHQDYQRAKMYLPNYRKIDLLRTGLYIKELYDRGDNEDKINNIRNKICARPNGHQKYKIVRLATTQYFSIILDFLGKMKVEENYTEEQLEDLFEEIASEQKKQSKFVDTKDSDQSVKSFCENQIQRNERIFLAGIKSAAECVEKVVNELKDSDHFEDSGYRTELRKTSQGTEPRVEFMAWPGTKGMFPAEGF